MGFASAMPGLNGLLAAEEINRERPVPVIVISGRHDVESRAAAAANIVAFLAKPIKPTELRAAVESVASSGARA